MALREETVGWSAAPRRWRRLRHMTTSTAVPQRGGQEQEQGSAGRERGQGGGSRGEEETAQALEGGDAHGRRQAPTVTHRPPARSPPPTSTLYEPHPVRLHTEVGGELQHHAAPVAAGVRDELLDAGVKVDPHAGGQRCEAIEEDFRYFRHPDSAAAEQVGKQDGPLLSGISYCIASCSMILLNKVVLSSYNFNVAVSLMLYQNLISVVILLALEQFSVISTEQLTWKLIEAWIPVNFIFVAMLVTGMYGYFLLQIYHAAALLSTLARLLFA